MTGQVQPVLDRIVASGPEIGMQVAAYVDGQLVLDAWAGVADEATGRKVDGQTLFSASSPTFHQKPTTGVSMKSWKPVSFVLRPFTRGVKYVFSPLLPIDASPAGPIFH